jgi:undecaprenyl-diphosphatase
MQTANAEMRLWFVAAMCFALFALLGLLVSQRTPTRIDVEAVALRGVATPLAAFFTALGRWPGVAGICLAAAIAFYFMHANLRAMYFIAAAQVVSQAAAALLKLAFHRIRPDYWLLHQELDFSYPSGHAVTSVVLFLGLAILIWRNNVFTRPTAATAIVILAICIVGIPWSRLALGAHYLTDVAGGVLFGAGWLCITLALIARFAPRAAM